MKIRLSLAALLFAFAGLQEAGAQLLFSNYGSAVAVSNGEVLVGEPHSRYRPGLVYIYGKDAEGWSERAHLTAPDGVSFDGFGHALAVSGDDLFVAASRVGRVYLYARDASGSWTNSAVIDEPDLATEEGFASSVAISGDLAAVGAPGKVQNGPPGHPKKKGAVYIYRRGRSGEWARDAVLKAGDASSGSAFGHSVAIVDGRIVVGAPGTESHAGAAYVFASDAGEWKQQAVLTLPSGGNGAEFGASIAEAGGRILVGAPGADPAGVVVAFIRGEDGWLEERTFAPFEEAERAAFGAHFAAGENDLWIAAPVDLSRQGSVYGFANDSGEWVKSAIITAEDGKRGDFFGGAVAVGDGVLVVGALGDDGMAGSAAVFERSGDDWLQTASLRSEPATLAPITGAEHECSDGAADIFDCSKVDLIAFLPVHALGGERGVMVNDLWGWTDPETGREWVLQGRTNGTAFVDVTDPSNPIFVGQLPLTKGANPNVWRDIKVYKDHAFVVADGAGEHGVQVFDLTRLRNVTAVPTTYDEDAVYRGISSAHNIVINEETGFAYTTGSSGGGESCGGGLHMIDIRDPQDPTFAGCFSHEGTGYRGTGYTHDAQCVIYRGPDGEYRGREICFSANETALSIGDVTDKADVKYLSQGSYPNSAYVHQGWLTEDHRYFYINDEGDEVNGNVDQTRTLIWDISDLDDPQLAKEYTWGERSSDHNLYVRGNLMYQSNYVSGLRVHDISDPENPQEVAYFDTVPVGDNGPGFAGSWSNYPYFKSDVIAVSSMQEGLFLLKRQSEPGL